MTSDQRSFQQGDQVTWIGSELAAPGPGTLMEGYRLKFGIVVYELRGTVLRVSQSDPDSIKVRWDNGRVTIERSCNLGDAVTALAAA